MRRAWAGAALALLSAACGPQRGPAGEGARVPAEQLRVGEAAPALAPEAAAPERLPSGTLELPSGKRLTVELARTAETRERGLMFRTELPADYGMLFVFGREQLLQFWMMNTFVDLDMVFLDDGFRITGIAERVPRSRRDTPPEQVARRSGWGRFVLELPAGAAARHGLAKGQSLRMEQSP